MVTAINLTSPTTEIKNISAVHETKTRLHDTERYRDTLQSMKESQATSKPELETTFSYDSTSPGVVFARMMDTMQKYVKSTAVTAELKHERLGNNIQKAQKKLRDVQKQTLDVQKQQETWNTRQMVANCVLNGVSVMTGIGLAMAGNPFTGGALALSGIGGTASELMKHYGWNSTLTAATSLVSGVVGIFGGLMGVGQMVRGPSLFMNRLVSEPVTRALHATGFITSLVSTGISGYANIERNKTSALLAEIDALHTETQTNLRLLEQKYASASTAFQGTVKNFSGLLKSVAKTQTRYTRDCLRVLTAEYPA